MAAFRELDWRRLDVRAIVEQRGVGNSNEDERAPIRAWLHAEGYELLVLDFEKGISPVVAQLGEVLSWADQFGYELSPASRSLDALRDGFSFVIAEKSTGMALHLIGFAKARAEDPAWATGLVEIISENSLRELALGRRFFALVEE